jgi:methylmalonyl-CoA/ethylmalonyl-CoA epimerase
MLSTERPFRIEGINHVGLAAKDPEKTKWFFNTILGFEYFGEELVASQETNTKMFGSSSAGTKNLAQARLEILVPTSESSPIAKFQAKKGSGLHHLALTVNDISAAIAFLIAKEIKMIDAVPRNGAHNTTIAFVHPESTGGLLVELVQEKNK